MTNEVKDAEASIRFAKKYIEDLLSFFGLNTDVYATREDEVIELSVPSTRLNGFLIGQHGDTIRAFQYVISNALISGEYELHRVNVDIADYKKNRNDKLAEKVELWISDVIASKASRSVAPMNAADRRIVHKTVGENSRVASESSGVGRERHVVISYIPDEAEA